MDRSPVQPVTPPRSGAPLVTRASVGCGAEELRNQRDDVTGPPGFDAGARDEPVTPLLRGCASISLTSDVPSTKAVAGVARSRSGGQLTAFFTSPAIFASSAGVNSFSAKEVGHMLPSSRFAVALKPNVAYLSLNFDAAVK